MKVLYIFLLSESVLLPLIAGLVRFSRIGKSYRPFFTLIFIAALNELVSFVLIRGAHVNNAIPYNIYSLIEWLLIAWQFGVWGLLRKRRTFYYILVAMVSMIWVWEDLILGKITSYPPYFEVAYAFFIVLFSINIINFMITHDYRNLFGHPTFLICIAFIIYFIYGIITQWAYVTSSGGGENSTTRAILMLINYINALTNVIFAIAILRIPRPQKFTLR
jgi:hypothetical protein